MAAGINILVNDGGAPARIMKLGLAAADIDAGTFVGIDTNAKVSATDLADLPANSEAVGVLFVDAVSGQPASVLTGSGVQVFLKSTGAIAAGGLCGHDGSGLLKAVAGADADDAMAVALEAKSDTHTDFTKVLLL